MKNLTTYSVLLIAVLVISSYFGAAVPGLIAISCLAIPMLVRRIRRWKKPVRPAPTAARRGQHLALILGIVLFLIGGGINQYVDRQRAPGAPHLDPKTQNRLSRASDLLIPAGITLAIGSALSMFVMDRRLQKQSPS